MTNNDEVNPTIASDKALVNGIFTILKFIIIVAIVIAIGWGIVAFISSLTPVAVIIGLLIFIALKL